MPHLALGVRQTIPLVPQWYPAKGLARPIFIIVPQPPLSQTVIHVSEHSFEPQCPLPLASDETIRLAHGGGGRLMQKLIHEIFLEAFSNSYLTALQDSAVLPAQDGRLAMTTDSYVVQPLFFPGGDIGSLAVHGTINDLAMMGASPRYLSAGFILEEGLPIATLKHVVSSMAKTARNCGVQIVCGDTKVVDRGKGDQIFINTTGLGVIPSSVDIGPHRLTPGDRIIVSGNLGRTWHRRIKPARRLGVFREPGQRFRTTSIPSLPICSITMLLSIVFEI